MGYGLEKDYKGKSVDGKVVIIKAGTTLMRHLLEL